MSLMPSDLIHPVFPRITRHFSIYRTAYKQTPPLEPLLRRAALLNLHILSAGRLDGIIVAALNVVVDAEFWTSATSQLPSFSS